MNVDAWPFANGSGTRFVVFIRNMTGDVKGAHCWTIHSYLDLLVAECSAIRDGLRFAKGFNLRVDVIESDCLLIVNDINKECSISILDSLLAYVQALLLKHGGGTSCFIPIKKCDSPHPCPGIYIDVTGLVFAGFMKVLIILHVVLVPRHVPVIILNRFAFKKNCRSFK